MATISTRPQPDYNCTQAELYAGLHMTWNSQAQHEAEFLAENTKYTPGLSVTRKAAIDAADALPDGQARYANAEDLKVDLKEDWEEGIEKWNSLEGYISKTFTGEHYKPRVEEAGKLHYVAAYNKDWEEVKQLLQAGDTFITAHSAALAADGGMPAAFAAGFGTAKTDFTTTYENYMEAREDAQEQTDVKILANNAIYKDGREMMDDGKHIFRKEASVRERFIWKKILEMVTPTGGTAGTNLVFEGDVPADGLPHNIQLGTFEPTPQSRVETVVTGGELDLYAAPAPNVLPTGTIYHHDADTTTDDSLEEFTTLCGFSETNTKLNTRNAGVSPTHYVITFTNVVVPE